MLSSPFHMHATLKLAPVLSQKLEEMLVVLCRKNRYGDPYFFVHDLIRTMLPFNYEKKLA